MGGLKSAGGDNAALLMPAAVRANRRWGPALNGCVANEQGETVCGDRIL